MKQSLQSIFTGILSELGVSGVAAEVVISDDASHGEYTTNLALRLAKPLKKSPMEIALQVKNILETHISRTASIDGDQKVSNNIQIVQKKSER